MSVMGGVREIGCAKVAFTVSNTGVQYRYYVIKSGKIIIFQQSKLHSDFFKVVPSERQSRGKKGMRFISTSWGVLRCRWKSKDVFFG